MFKKDEDQWEAVSLSRLERQAKYELHISDLIDKNVKSARSEDGYVVLDSQYNLGKYLCDISLAEDYKDWFILVRTNKELYELSQKLTRAHIPFHTFKQGNVSTAELNKIMNSNTVKLLTVHASKGLENKKVLLYGNFQIKLPKYKRVNSEERKIFYVAITRAMDELVILS